MNITDSQIFTLAAHHEEPGGLWRSTITFRRSALLKFARDVIAMAAPAQAVPVGAVDFSAPGCIRWADGILRSDIKPGQKIYIDSQPTVPTAVVEAVPAERNQVKPFAYTSKAGLNKEKIGENYGVLPVRSCMVFGDFDHVFDQPIYLYPIIKNYSPAIDDETRKLVLELCDYVDGEKALPHCPSILTEQIRERLEAGQ